MAYYLTIRQGDAPEDSYPIFATADQEIIELVAKSLVRKLTVPTASRVSMLIKKPDPTTKEPPSE